ncbi:MAG: GNAT family N-acetyltransferase [Chloroflexota bacterium]
MNIRNATEKDTSSLRQMRPNFDEHIAYRLTAQTNGKGEFLIVEEADEVVSFVFLKYTGKSTYPDYPDIEDLFTKVDKRRKGYAQALLLECEKRAMQRGFQTIGLAASPDPADPGHQLYRKLGYQHDGKESYVDGVYDGVEDWVIDMEKVLIDG